MTSNSKLIFDSYCILTDASPLYQQCWMCNETIFRMLNSHFPHLKKAFNFTRSGLNRVLSVKASPCSMQNSYGIYVARFHTECPYSGDLRRRVWYYFRQDTNDNQPPDDPVLPSDVIDKYASSNQLQRNCIRLGNYMPNVLVGLGGGSEGRGGGMGGTWGEMGLLTRTLTEPEHQRKRGKEGETIIVIVVPPP